MVVSRFHGTTDSGQKYSYLNSIVQESYRAYVRIHIVHNNFLLRKFPENVPYPVISRDVFFDIRYIDCIYIDICGEIPYKRADIREFCL